METVEAVAVSLAQNPLDLGLETEVRRRQVAGVHLEILRDRIDAVDQGRQQRRVRRLGRHDRTR